MLPLKAATIGRALGRAAESNYETHTTSGFVVLNSLTTRTTFN